MSQMEWLIYIITIQGTVSVLGGHFLAANVVNGGIDFFKSAGIALPTPIAFLVETYDFFTKLFIFQVNGLEYLTPLWILMGIVELIILANFLRSGIS